MNNIIERKWKQNSMVNIEDLRGMAFQAEKNAHTFRIRGVDASGEAIALNGSVGAVFLRADNTDVAITGTVEDGAAVITLPEECYDMPGRFGLTVFLTSDEQTVAIYAAIGSVSRTSSGNVSPESAADIADLIDRINDAIEDLDEAIAAIPQDYQELEDDVSDLKNAFESYRLGELPITIIKNSYVTTSGEIASYNGWDRTDYIPVKNIEYIKAKTNPTSGYNVFFDANKEKIGSNFQIKTTFVDFYVPDGAEYVIMSNTASGMQNLQVAFKNKDEQKSDNNLDLLNTYHEELFNSCFNLIDQCKFTNGVVYNSVGEQISGTTSGQSVATPFRINANTTYYFKNINHSFSYFRFFDGTNVAIAETDNGTVTPTKDGYAYLSIAIDLQGTALFTESADLYNSGSSSSYWTAKKLYTTDHVFRVGANKEFTSLLEGIIAAERFKNAIVYVDPGTYDMTQEFKTKYGNDYFTSENYLSQENHRGCPLNNGVHVIGYGGVTVTGGLASTDSQDAIGDWSIFAAGDDTNGDNGYGFTLENITIKSTSQHIRYLVHDEYGLTNYNYINKYLNIHFEVFPGYVKRCIGGGLGSHGYILIDNCTISAPAYDETIRGINYHNDANTGALNEIYIKNCYIPNGTVGITWYGQTPATEKSMLYVNNCYLQAEPVKKAETASAPYENVDIVSWCNTIAP